MLGFPSEVYLPAEPASVVRVERSDKVLKRVDIREGQIRRYFQRHGAPMAPYAKSFVKYGNKYGVDPILIAAIAQKESQGGKVMVNTYNPFGRRASGGGWMAFSSFDAAIENQAIYLSKYYSGMSIETMGKKYCPPTWEEWSEGIRYISAQINGS